MPIQQPNHSQSVKALMKLAKTIFEERRVLHVHFLVDGMNHQHCLDRNGICRCLFPISLGRIEVVFLRVFIVPIFCGADTCGLNLIKNNATIAGYVGMISHMSRKWSGLGWSLEPQQFQVVIQVVIELQLAKYHQYGLV